MNSGPVPRAPCQSYGVLCPSSVIFQLSDLLIFLSFFAGAMTASAATPAPTAAPSHLSKTNTDTLCCDPAEGYIRLPSQSLVWGVHAREARANLFVFRSRTVLRLFVHLHAPFCQRLCRRLEGIFIGSLGVDHVLKFACRSQAEARIWSPGG